MKLNIWNLEYITIGDLELKRRKIKGLIAEFDTIVIPIIALNLTFLFSVDSWQLFIPIIALKRAIFFGVKSWLLIPIFTLNWTIFLDVDSKAFYPSLWFKLDNFRSCQKVDSMAFYEDQKAGRMKSLFSDSSDIISRDDTARLGLKRRNFKSLWFQIGFAA